MNMKTPATAQKHTFKGVMSSIGRFIVSSPMPFIVLIIGGINGLLWSNYQQIATWIFLALTAYAVVDALMGIVRDIRHGHVGVDILAIIAILATTVVGEQWASWIVVLMIYSGDAIEDFAQSRAGRNLTALVDAAPQIAHVLREKGEKAGSEAAPTEESFDPDASYNSETGERLDYAEGALDYQPPAYSKEPSASDRSVLLPSPDHSGGWDTVDVDKVHIGDRLVVKPGETVPVNGVLLSEQATVDLSMINGEPVPVDVYRGGHISSGAINGSDTLTMQASATAASSQYQKILQLVKTAQESRATVVKTADMLAVPFTVISLVIAFLAWYFSGDPVRFAQVLVLATPCPLLIAAPVAYMGGTGRLAKIGVIIKTQDVLENLGNVSHIFFDKTGTLTRKRPEVARVDVVEGSSYSTTDVLRLAGPLEAYSVHILAKGISVAATNLIRDQHLKHPVVEGAREDSGNGTLGRVDGHDVRIGRMGFVDSNAADNAAKKLFSALEPNEMVAYVSIDGTLAARIVLRDFARNNAASAVRKLRDLGIKRLSMLTGDNYASATAIADEVGITDVHAQLLPEEKVDALKNAQRDTLPHMSALWRFLRHLAGAPDPAPVTMMVGDGVNDAPVLASATIGAAMTDGSSTAASESAQVVIMNDDIEMVPSAILISRQTKRTMLQAVLAGLGIAIVLMVLAACNLIPVVLGALLQEVIDVLSILWALTAIIDRKK
ncbi:MAG: heavy metal translocating P-type ATPase [Bifidobacteriaceae bacterium]|jgi:heavy metal translocating P-type ATPase|nr:heavy metal translocating P-type ATPase [Bifidobacteriaceae bacterium]